MTDAVEEFDVIIVGAGISGIGAAHHLADEVATVAAWLEREAARVRLVSCSDELASHASRVPAFEPRSRDGSPERTATKVLLRTTP